MNVVGETWTFIKEYMEEYKDVIKSRDTIKIPFSHKSVQLEHRKYMIDHMKEIALKKKLIHSTLHLAVYILDVYMDSHIISRDIFLLLSNVCLLLAAKMDEQTHNVPKLADLNDSIENRYAIADYKQLEIIVLKSFDWYLNFPTPAYYAHYFFQAILDREDLKIIRKCKESIREAYTQLNINLIDSLDRFIDDVHYMQYYEASKLAAAAISAARVKFGLSKWNLQLRRFTDYEDADIKEIRDFLLQPYSLMCIHCCNQ